MEAVPQAQVAVKSWSFAEKMWAQGIALATYRPLWQAL